MKPAPELKEASVFYNHFTSTRFSPIVNHISISTFLYSGAEMASGGEPKNKQESYWGPGRSTGIGGRKSKNHDKLERSGTRRADGFPIYP